MDKFSTLVSPNCRNFVAGSKRFICSGMGFLDSIMALKNHFGFKSVHDSQIPRQLKDKVFVFKILKEAESIWWSSCNVKETWKIQGSCWSCEVLARLDYYGVSRIRQQTLQGSYNSMFWYTIRGCPTPYRFRGKFNVVMVKFGIPNVNFKGFMVEDTQPNWIDVRKI